MMMMMMMMIIIIIIANVVYKEAAKFSTLIPNTVTTATLHKTTKIDQPIYIHPEDGNCSFAETLDNSEYLMRLIPESRSITLNASCENLRLNIMNIMK
jgi:flavoprotein